jgi:hypothetical protein
MAAILMTSFEKWSHQTHHWYGADVFTLLMMAGLLVAYPFGFVSGELLLAEGDFGGMAFAVGWLAATPLIARN